jgi:1-aminocyclopropane-1-carboxylate deaminase/D-cysteine desulfhydrase-like pyridoxal-dependent ACC family enzyme
LFVDPNYSGPVLNAIIDDVENDHINENDNIVFLHTGGLPSIFSYAEELTS